MGLLRLGLNMDCGEDLPGIYNHVDEMIMPYLSYCNIACGFHAGSTDIVKKTLLLAKQYQVKPGAHPSFKDRENFGRKYMDVPSNILIDQIAEQILILHKISNEVGIPLFHVKAHGSLYNAAMKNEKEALAMVNAVSKINKELIIFVMRGSMLEKVALENGCKVMYETFGDRNYSDVHTLVSRDEKGALKETAHEVVDQIIQLSEGKVTLIDGTEEAIISDTICLHGDHPMIFDTLNILEKL